MATTGEETTVSRETEDTRMIAQRDISKVRRCQRWIRGAKKCVEEILHRQQQREEYKIPLAEKQVKMVQEYFK